MKAFFVEWATDVDADDARDAARQAWATMRASGSTACVFEVTEIGAVAHVDLIEYGDGQDYDEHCMDAAMEDCA